MATKKKLSVAQRKRRVLRFLKRKVWPTIPQEFLGRRPTREEEDEILGYGPEPATPKEAR